MNDDDLAAWRGDPALVFEALADIVGERPAWHAEALCRGRGSATWFSKATSRTARAVQVCRRCPVRQQCADAGQDEPYGVWGGLTPQERRRAA